MADNKSYKNGKTEFDKACRTIDCGYKEPTKSNNVRQVNSKSDNTGVILIVAVVVIVVLCAIFK